MTDAPPPEDAPADPRDVLIREQAAQLEAQAEKIAGQAERIAALEALVADLRERLEAAERAGSRNSENSSMPPSSDDLPGRKPPRRQRRAAERAEKKLKLCTESGPCGEQPSPDARTVTDRLGAAGADRVRLRSFSWRHKGPPGDLCCVA